PPVMGLADAPLISSVAVHTLVVLEAGATGRSQGAAALRRLTVAHAHILGAVLTKFNVRQASYGYGYGYQYEYDYGRTSRPLETVSGRLRNLWPSPRRLPGAITPPAASPGS
ncbi:MAG TPA: hypothetical protein VIJ94_12900, partial [Caulobacteraceae bacterium]